MPSDVERRRHPRKRVRNRGQMATASAAVMSSSTQEGSQRLHDRGAGQVGAGRHPPKRARNGERERVSLSQHHPSSSAQDGSQLLLGRAVAVPLGGSSSAQDGSQHLEGQAVVHGPCGRHPPKSVRNMWAREGRALSRAVVIRPRGFATTWPSRAAARPASSSSAQEGSQHQDENLLQELVYESSSAQEGSQPDSARRRTLPSARHHPPKRVRNMPSFLRRSDLRMLVVIRPRGLATAGVGRRARPSRACVGIRPRGLATGPLVDEKTRPRNWSSSSQEARNVRRRMMRAIGSRRRPPKRVRNAMLVTTWWHGRTQSSAPHLSGRRSPVVIHSRGLATPGECRVRRSAARAGRHPPKRARNTEV
jgi:hypothetical protein